MRIRRTRIGAIAVVGALGMTSAIFAATALPAAAASSNVAYAVGTSGLLGNLQPLGEASYPGNSPVTLAQLTALGLVNVAAATDTAGPTSASAKLAEVDVLGMLGLGALSVEAITSSCSYDASTNTLSGTASIVGGTLTGLLSGPLSGPLSGLLPTNPAPNTTIGVPGVATITLNKQVNTGSSLQVDALSVSVLGGLETITLGTSICNATGAAGG